MDAMKIANSIPMWLACALPVAFVILQAVLFARGAYKSGKKLGLNDKQMKKAMKKQCGNINWTIHRCIKCDAFSVSICRRANRMDEIIYDWIRYV
mgnify:FL=1